VRRVAITGHVCVDLIPELGGSAQLKPGALIDVGPLALRVGGCVANTSRVLADLGHPVTAYATIGDDELGQVVRTQLGSGLVDARLSTHPAGTSYSLVLEPGGADRTFWHYVGANAVTDAHDVDLAGADVLHLGYPSLLPAMLSDDAAPLIGVLKQARAAGVTTSIDLAVVDPGSRIAALDWPVMLRAIASRVDILTPSLDDLTSVLRIDARDDEDLAELFAELLVSWGAGIVVISAGTRGSVMRTADRRRLAAGGRAVSPLAETWADIALRAPAITVDSVRTTNGAGDASTAGILYGISRGLAPDRTLRLASACSAAVVSGRPTTADAIADIAADL
jgi:sugar/nucleoside kinase (ribokinase family)